MRYVLGLAIGLAVVGCGSARGGQGTASAECPYGHGPGGPAAASGECPHGHGRGPGMAAGMCPLQVEGTAARAEDVEGGAAIVFTTTGDVAELRRRVAAMAEHHAAHAEGACACPMAASTPAHEARAEDVDGGARLVLTTSDPEDVEALRSNVREHADRMSSGACPMMGGGSSADAT